MKAYLATIKIAFKSNIVYRTNTVVGIINTVIQIFIYTAIWKALYNYRLFVNDISFSMIATNFALGLALISSYTTSDFDIQNKIKDGSIGNELLKPINYRGLLLANDLGNIFFKILTNFLPSFIIAIIFIGIKPPTSIISLAFFIASIILGFFIFWLIGIIVKQLAFWIVNVWSISTIKNVLISLFSGALIPIWFMPIQLQKFVSFTPFESIYYTPLKIYFGQVRGNEILHVFIIQLIWIVLLYLIGKIMWIYGERRIVIQGG